MSLRAISIVLEASRHPGTKKLVLLSLADRADEMGEHCHPGYEYIAARSNCTVRRVIDLVSELEAEGVLEVWRDDKGGRSMTNSYSLRRWLEYQETMIGKRAAEAREKAGKGEKIAGVKRLHPYSPDGAPKGEIQREKGEVERTERVQSGGAGFHPIRHDPSLEKKEATALPSSPSPDGGASPKSPGTGPIPLPPEMTLAAALQAEWRRWDEYLDELGVVRTRGSKEAERMNASRHPTDRVVEVIRFSILKRAKHLLLDAARKEMPRHLWCEVAAAPAAPAAVVPGLAVWLAKTYPRADSKTPWEGLDFSLREQFSKAHPGLKFRGLHLQFYVGNRLALSNGKEAA